MAGESGRDLAQNSSRPGIESCDVIRAAPAEEFTSIIAS
jgi:hypothetical protein